MARRLGDHYKLYVYDGSAYTVIAGQTGLTVDSPQDLIDQTAKGDTYKSRQPGRPDRTITCTGGVQLPDTNGLEKIYSNFVARTSVAVQVRYTPFTGSEISFAATMFVSNFSRDLADQQNATFSFQLTLDTQPTVDTLGA